MKGVKGFVRTSKMIVFLMGKCANLKRKKLPQSNDKLLNFVFWCFNFTLISHFLLFGRFQIFF